MLTFPQVASTIAVKFTVCSWWSITLKCVHFNVFTFMKWTYYIIMHIKRSEMNLGTKEKSALFKLILETLKIEKISIVNELIYKSVQRGFNSKLYKWCNLLPELRFRFWSKTTEPYIRIKIVKYVLILSSQKIPLWKRGYVFDSRWKVTKKGGKQILLSFQSIRTKKQILRSFSLSFNALTLINFKNKKTIRCA